MKNQKNSRLAGMLILAGLLIGNFLVLPTGKAFSANQQIVQPKASVVNINKADAAELDSIRGIGPKLAERIVKYRQEHGNFQRAEDLANVSGIGGAKFEKIKNQVTV